MVTWYDYTTHQAVCLPAIGEVALCTLYHGDDVYRDVSVKITGEWKGDAVVGISELNPDFDHIDSLFDSVVRIEIENLRPLDANSIITQWRPFSTCPFSVRVAFKKHNGAIFSGDRRGDGRAWSELNNNPADINPPFWQPIDDTLRNVIINNYSQQKPKPRRWTWEDKKDGVLPEAGTKVMQCNEYCTVDILSVHNGYIVACNSDIDDSRPVSFAIERFIELFNPIETPAEKAARLKSEWCAKAAKQLKNLEYTSTLTSIYDALLSGELKAPESTE